MKSRLIVNQITNNIRKTYHNGFFGLILSGVEQINIEERNHIQIDYKPIIELKSGEVLKDSYRLSINSNNSEEIIELLIKILKQKPTSLKLKIILDKIEDVFKSEDQSYIRTIGLIGELVFIDEFLKLKPNYVFELFSYYQTNETNGLIDFYKKGEFSIEIKTNSKDDNIHSFYDIEQLNFNELNYYIGSVSLKLNEQGLNIMELIEIIEKKLDEKAIELFRDKVYPILMRGINKSIKYIDYKLNFYASVDISKIEIPTEYIIDSVKIDFSEKIKMQFKETINLIFN